jgi:hypothetical protein
MDLPIGLSTLNGNESCHQKAILEHRRASPEKRKVKGEKSLVVLEWPVTSNTVISQGLVADLCVTTADFWFGENGVTQILTDYFRATSHVSLLTNHASASSSAGYVQISLNVG